MPSPARRSARAQPAISTTSSASIPTTRRDRSTRGSVSHPKSTTPHSRSSEEMSEPPRRSKRAHPAAEPEVLSAAQEADEEAAEDEEEVTRCLCGQQEYPGPPLSEAYGASDAQTDDAGGLFIQCDGCSVWQHGGCVGIFDEAQSPDKYYCEECKPKQHEVHVDSRGQRYSLYLPVTAKLRRESFGSKSDEKARKERMEISRGSIDPVSGKRRGTMRSREHDEEAEQIQRAIEESAREAGRRGGKRSRDDSSEDTKQDAKRARRISEAELALSRNATIDDESDDDNEDGNFSGRSKKAKAEAAMTARQSEQREKESERERARAEAAGRRQARAGRRRQDDLEPEETPKLNSTSHTSPPPSSQPESPPPAAQEKVTQKKGAGRKVKRLGNNQYTKHRGEAPTSAGNGTSSPHSKKRGNNSHTSSGDEHLLANGNGESTSTPDVTVPATTTGNGTGKGGGRWGKGKKNALANGIAAKPMEPAERTIPNMARNLDAMMGFIQRAQMEAATDRARLGSERSPSSRAEGELEAMEMAEELTKGIREWQGRFGAEAVST